MARDLAGWAALAEQAAAERFPDEPGVNPYGRAGFAALAAVLREVADRHKPQDDFVMYDTDEHAECPACTLGGGHAVTACSWCRAADSEGIYVVAVPSPCREVRDHLAALAPLAPLFPDTEGGGDG